MPERPWWRDAVVYEVYLRSFADSDGDGIGDLAGLRSRLDYLADLGVDAVWVTPFYPSPMADHGYDVADYRDVAPVFGDLAQFDALVRDAHAAGLKLIIDVVPNHTSCAHPWFRAALSGPGSPYRDWYVFGDAPNNWTSVFGGSAWARDVSGQHYLHLFAPEQPDLNWRNPAVHDEWERILAFWLDRGVDGFRIDVAHGLYKAAGLPADPMPGGAPLPDHVSPKWNQPEVHEVYRRWRTLASAYPGERVLVGEVFLLDVESVAGYVGPDTLQLAFNFTVSATPFDATALRAVLRQALAAHAARDAPCTWVLSNHDLVRHATRYGGGPAGRRRALAATLTVLGLPGSPYLYQGEELGLEQVDVPPHARQDPTWERSGYTLPGRDGARTPMPWSAEPPGFGFTDAAAGWLPFGPDAGVRNVESQQADPDSTLACYRRALALRRTAVRGLAERVEWLDTSPGVLGYLRRGPGTVFGCLLNTGAQTVCVDLAPCGGLVEVILATGSATVRDGQLMLPSDSAAWVGTL